MNQSELLHNMRACPDLRIAAEDIDALIARLSQGARTSMSVTRDELHAIARAKSPRSADMILRNSAETVRTVTGLAFRTEDPFVQIGLLRSLHGVDIPVASAILCWTFPNRWPVIDQRAWRVLRSSGLVAGCDNGRGFRSTNWIKYVEVVSRLAEALDWSQQEVDTWLYHKGGGKRGALA